MLALGYTHAITKTGPDSTKKYVFMACGASGLELACQLIGTHGKREVVRIKAPLCR